MEQSRLWTQRVTANMAQRTFENLLYTIRDVGFASHEDGAVLSDGRVSSTDDPLKMVRKWVDEIQVHWRTVYEPGSLLVVDESMIGWTGATNIHMTYLPNKPTSRGVCLKTLADGNTRARVMLAIEFVESATLPACCWNGLRQWSSPKVGYARGTPLGHCCSPSPSKGPLRWWRT
jgi:hypothetical protein